MKALRFALATVAFSLAAPSAAAVIEDASWLAGRWVGEGLGGKIEETWAPAAGGQMIGQFQLVKDGQPSFYELMLLDVQRGGLRLRVKHFNPDFTAWEDKGGWHSFEPVAVEKDRLRFNGLRFDRDGDELVIVVTLKQRDGSVADHSIRLLSILIDAFPVFVMLLVYRFIFAVPLSNWMADQFGRDSILALMFKPSFDANNPWVTLIVPGILLGLGGAAPFLRLVRASQLENYNADHVRTAKSKGLSDRRVTVFHIVRNSSIPVVTAVGFVFAEALAGAVITEGVMNIYGMGGVLWNAVRDSEVSVVIGIVTLLSVVTIVVMLVVDIIYALLDPRIRYD